MTMADIIWKLVEKLLDEKEQNKSTTDPDKED